MASLPKGALPRFPKILGWNQFQSCAHTHTHVLHCIAFLVPAEHGHPLPIRWVGSHGRPICFLAPPKQAKCQGALFPVHGTNQGGGRRGEQATAAFRDGVHLASFYTQSQRGGSHYRTLRPYCWLPCPVRKVHRRAVEKKQKKDDPTGGFCTTACIKYPT